MKEAYYYIILSDSIRCLLCPNECIIKESEKGICKTKMNWNNKLISIAYGNPCAVNIDPIEKKPLYHFLPSSKIYSIATAGCNLCCKNCQNSDISQHSPSETTNYDLMPDELVKEVIKNNIPSIAYTYTEPIAFYEYTFDTCKIAKSKAIKNIIITGGFVNKKPLRELAKFVDGANVNLKSFSDDIYKRLNCGRLQTILNTLKILKEENVWLEITNLIVPEWTDNMDMIKKMCEWLYNNGFQENPLHFNRFFPSYELKHLPATPIDVIENAREIAVNSGIKYVYTGNLSMYEGENTYCPNCKKIIIQRNGYNVLSLNISSGLCKFCNEKISGVWNNE